MHRIVSTVPSLTELLVHLGLRDSIVGLTKFCVHPNDLKKEKTVVGGTKSLHIEKILGLDPTVIVCNKEENEKSQIEALMEKAEVILTDIKDYKSALLAIETIGSYFDSKTEAKSLIDSINKARSNYERFKPKSKRALYLIWKDPIMVAGGDTYIHSMMDICGFENLAVDLSRYPSLNQDEIEMLEPEILLLSSEPYPFSEKHQKMLKEIYKNCEVKLVDGEMFSWYGSRMLKAFDYFTYAFGKDYVS